VVCQSRVRHLESFHGNGTDSSKICLITLTFQNGLLTQLDPVFFFQLFYHAFKELELIFFLCDFGIDFDNNFFFDSLFQQSISRNLCEQLESLHTSSLEADVEEVIAVGELPPLSGVETCPVFVIGKDNFL
jgi:hypothetical protein